MNKFEFDNMGIDEQIEYMNSNLIAQTLTTICISIGISRSTVRERFLKVGYVFNAITKQYAKDTTLVIQPYQISPRRAPVSYSNTIELQKYDDISELIEHKEDILEMLKYYKSNINVIDIPQLDINTLPLELQTTITAKSIKVYEPIYKLFDLLCSSYSGIKRQDLMSLAIFEFYTKYKK